METSTFGYVLGSIILIAILSYKLYQYNKKRSDKPIPEKDENLIRNGFIDRELIQTYNTLQDYKQFLEKRLTNKIPEIAAEVQQVYWRMRFIRNIIAQIEDHNPEEEISEERWADVIRIAHQMVQIGQNRRPITQEDERKLDETINDLIRKGHLPEDYLTAVPVISPEQKQRYHKDKPTKKQ